MYELNDEENQKLSELQDRFLNDVEIEDKSADNFSLYIAKIDPELAWKLIQAERVIELEQKSEEEILLEKFHSLFWNRGVYYIDKRCKNEIKEIRIASSSEKRKRMMDEIRDKVYESIIDQLKDELSNSLSSDSNDIIEIPDTFESLINKIDELLPGVDTRFTDSSKNKSGEAPDNQILPSSASENFPFQLNLMGNELKDLIVKNQRNSQDSFNEVIQLLKANKEKDKKKIENMAKSYIDTCKHFRTDKPTREMLSAISRLSETIWKHTLANSKFLYPLSKFLEKEMNNSRNDKEFWRGAIIIIEKKLSKVLEREIINRGNKKDGGSKQQKIKATINRADSEEHQESSHLCKYCENIIPISQELCQDCRKLFPTTE